MYLPQGGIIQRSGTNNSTAELVLSDTIPQNQIERTVTGSLSSTFSQEVSFPTPSGSLTATGTNTTYTRAARRNGLTGLAASSLRVNASTDPRIPAGAGVAHETNYANANSLQYTDYGIWTIDPNTSLSTTPFYAGVYAGARPGGTPSTSIPTSGTATYAGGATGFMTQGGRLATFYGPVALTANFSAGTVTGDITGIRAFGTGFDVNTQVPGSSVSNITLSATISGVGFAGTATGSGTAGAPFNFTGASGDFRGNFFGPNGAEVGATFNLSGGAAGVSVVGSLGARQGAVPCDRRLKADIRPEGATAEGMPLFSWRYRGSRRRHVGPIAQALLGDLRFASRVSSDAAGLLWVDAELMHQAPAILARMRADGERAAAAWRRRRR